MLESLTNVCLQLLTAGLHYPIAASVLGVLYCIGNYFYLVGYSDTSKDVKGARYTHPLAVGKPIGLLGSMVLSVVVCVSMLMAAAPAAVEKVAEKVAEAAATPAE